MAANHQYVNDGIYTLNVSPFYDLVAGYAYFVKVSFPVITLTYY